MYVPAGEFRTGRSRVTFDRVEVEGRIWPPLADCEARVRGFEMQAAGLRPAAAMESLFEIEHMAGVSCESVRVDSGEIVLADSPPIRMGLDNAIWNRPAHSISVRIGRIDGQATSLTMAGMRRDSPVVCTGGEWNLSGLDVTALLARVGLSWSSATEVGLLEFQTAGGEREESGSLRISSWVLLGKNRPRPFRLSVPAVTAEFTASDSGLLFHRVMIDSPRFDLLGANPDFFKRMMTGAPVLNIRPKKSTETKIAVSDRHRARSAELPETFAVRVASLRVDSGAAVALDRPERTQFAIKISDLTVDLSGPAAVMGRTPNTAIRFRVNDKRDMRWSAITDFSTWPPEFRLTDVR